MNTPTTLLGVIGAIIVLILTVLAWIKQASDAKAKKKADIDAEIDAVSNADDVTRVADELRHK